MLIAYCSVNHPAAAQAQHLLCAKHGGNEISTRSRVCKTLPAVPASTSALRAGASPTS